LPYKKNIDLRVKIGILLIYQMENMKLTVSIQSSCQTSRHSSFLKTLTLLRKLIIVIYQTHNPHSSLRFFFQAMQTSVRTV